MQFLKYNTEVKVVIGPCVAVADGFTPVTSLDLSTADEAELMKHGASSVTDISGNTLAAITDMDGYYNLTLSAGNTDTVGMLTIGINDDSLCLPLIARFMVLPAKVYDSLIAGTDNLEVDTILIEATDATTVLDTQIDSRLDTAIGGSPTAGSIFERIKTLDDAYTAARAAYLDELAAANIPADIDTLLSRLSAARAGYLDELAAANIPADVDTLLSRLSTTRAGYLDNLSAGAVALEATLTAIKGAGWTNENLTTIDSLIDAIKAVTDNLPDSGALNDLAAILTDTGTTLPATLATIAGYIDTEVAAIKAVTDLLPDAGALNDLATIAGRLTAARAGYLDELAAANIPADVDTLLTRLSAARAGYLDNLSAGATALEATLTAMKGAGWTDENLTTIDTIIDAIKAKTDFLPSGIAKGAEFILSFFMALNTDHVSPATGKTVTVQVSKDGGAFAGATNSPAEVGNGWYKITLTATEMTADTIAVKVTETDCDQTNLLLATST